MNWVDPKPVRDRQKEVDRMMKEISKWVSSGIISKDVARTIVDQEMQRLNP